MIGEYKTYPNMRGHVRGEEGRGALRSGMVMRNDDTIKTGIDGYFAAVTYEQDGWVRCYLYQLTPGESLFPNTPMWIGPYQVLSEEIEEMEATI